MKNTTLYLLLLVLPFYVGCSSLLSGVDFPAFPIKNKEFDHLVGKRYEVVSPLVIGKFEQSWGGYVLEEPDVNIRKIVDVPVGSIIVLDHVSMSPDTAMSKFYHYKNYHYIAYFEDRNIFQGKFDVISLMVGPDNDTSLDPKYFSEIEWASSGDTYEWH